MSYNIIIHNGFQLNSITYERWNKILKIQDFEKRTAHFYYIKHYNYTYFSHA